MLLQSLSQLNVVKIVKCVYAGLETLVILLGDEKSVEGFVDSLVVEVLNRPQVRLDQLEVIVLGEEVHSPRVIEPWR